VKSIEGLDVMEPVGGKSSRDAHWLGVDMMEGSNEEAGRMIGKKRGAGPDGCEEVAEEEEEVDLEVHIHSRGVAGDEDENKVTRHDAARLADREDGGTEGVGLVSVVRPAPEAKACTAGLQHVAMVSLEAVGGVNALD
jgi:hypothetical protein